MGLIENKAIKTLYLFNGIFVLAASSITPIYAFFAADIGANIFTVSLLSAAFLGSRVLFTFVLRFVGDKIHEQEYLLLAGFLIRACAWLVLPIVGTVSGLFIVQVILGLGEAAGTPALNAIFAKHLSKGHPIAEYAGWDIVSTICAAIGTVVGGYIVSRYGFNVLFIAMGTLAILAFLGVLSRPRRLL